MDAVMHHELNGLESAIDRMIADRDRLQALNAELVAALEGLMASIGGGKKHCEHEYDCICAGDDARAALAKAKETAK